MKKNELLLSPVSLFVVVGVAYLVCLFIISIVLKMNIPVGDVNGYWQDSLSISSPYNAYHVPGYPYLIIIFNWITLGLLQPIWVMRIINLIALAVGIFMVYRIAFLVKPSQNLAVISAFLYACWPFVGITNSVHPLADAPALAFFLLGVYGLFKQRVILGGVVLGLALFTHKGTWPFVLLFILAWCWQNRTMINWRWLASLILLVLPLVALWLFGWSKVGNPYWILSSSMNSRYSFTSGQTIPFSGIISAFHPASIKDIARSGTILGSFLFGVFCFVYGLRSKAPWQLYSLAISFVVLFYAASFNYEAQWYTVRFARLLVLPVVWTFPNLPTNNSGDIEKWVKVLIILTALLLIFTQIVFTLYLRSYFDLS